MRAPLLAVACCLGCTTTATSSVSSVPTPEVRVATRARTWEVSRDGERLGFVVLFQERGRAADSVYVVRNAWHQDLGLIDGLGRAFRYLPHMREPAWVGSGTIAAGAERILGAAAECVLVELDAELRPLSTDPATAATDTASIAQLAPSTLPSSAPVRAEGLPQSD